MKTGKKICAIVVTIMLIMSSYGTMLANSDGSAEDAAAVKSVLEAETPEENIKEQDEENGQTDNEKEADLEESSEQPPTEITEIPEEEKEEDQNKDDKQTDSEKTSEEEKTKSEEKEGEDDLAEAGKTEEETAHVPANITNQTEQLKLNLGNAWYQDSQGDAVALDELSGAIDFRPAENIQTAGFDILYRLNQEGEDRIIHEGDWYEISLPSIFTNLRLNSCESYSAGSPADIAEVQISGSIIRVTFKQAIDESDASDLHGMLHIAFEVDAEALAETASEYSIVLQSSNTYTISLPVKPTDNEEDALNTEAVQNVRTIFRAILDEYFTDLAWEGMDAESAYDNVLGIVGEMDQDVLEACASQTTEALNAFDELPYEEADYFVETEGELYSMVMEILPEALASVLNGDIEEMSLLPLTEVKACLVLNGRTGDELKMSVKDILANLQDSDGNKIEDEIFKTATTVWRYTKDEIDGIETYEAYDIEKGEKIDLSSATDIASYTMELIVGSRNQFNEKNKRYIITVYISDEIQEEFNFELYSEEGGKRKKIVPTQKKETFNDQLGEGFEGYDKQYEGTKQVIYNVPEHNSESRYYLGITSMAAKHPERNVDIYTYGEYMMYLKGAGSPITDKILNQNMNISGAGYNGNFSMLENMADVFNEDLGCFVAVEKDLKGNEIRTTILVFCIASDFSTVDSSLFGIENSEVKDIVCTEATSLDIDLDDLYIDMNTGSVAGEGVYKYFYMLKPGYAADGKYYCRLKAHGTIYGDEANNYVVKAVKGLYDSLDEASGQADIKEQLMPVNGADETIGYMDNYDYSKEGVYFTAFFEDGAVWKFNVRTMAYNPKYDKNYMQSFTEAPIIGQKDPWFRVTGVNDESGNQLDTYVVENGKNINMDTMYGYGYQTVMIQDPDIDLKKIRPLFEIADPERITDIRVVDAAGQQKKVNSGDEINCDGSVQFIVVIDGNQKNYMVNFVKKVKGAKLFVSGPETRSVFLDEYFEYKHDIFIANIGDKPLTGLKATLNATNCKLDDYWTTSGTGSDTLAAFNETNSDTEYGEIANIAKIRLLPDGEGDIKGTLTITADGQKPVVITLNGRALNPQITTKEFKDAVKYVPYSYIITTNNMYDWNSVTFSIKSGAIPDGMTFDSSTGEIYGAPLKAGTYTFTVEAKYGMEEYFKPSEKEFTITVLDNENDIVFNTSDPGYAIIPVELGDIGYVGEQVSEYDFVVTSLDKDEIYISEGEYGQFEKLWLNGQELQEGLDYTKEAGSTRITVKAQTLKSKKVEGRNTISAEYNIDHKRGENLKRTSQNFRIDLSQGGEQPTVTQTPQVTQPPETTKIPDATEKPDATGTPSATVTPGTGSGTSVTGTPSATGVNNIAGTVTCAVYMVDGNDEPIENLPVEFHSTPQSGTTGADGKATFSGIDFGSHTVYVTGQSDGMTASKDFIIQQGDALSLSGDVITAKSGEMLTLKMQYAEGKISLLSVEGNSVSAPKTGDDTNIMQWALLMVLSLGTLTFVYRRRKVLK